MLVDVRLLFPLVVDCIITPFCDILPSDTFCKVEYPPPIKALAIFVLPDKYVNPVKLLRIELMQTELLFIPIVLFAISVVFEFTDVFNADTKF
jgi:hypothetical protein